MAPSSLSVICLGHLAYAIIREFDGNIFFSPSLNTTNLITRKIIENRLLVIVLCVTLLFDTPINLLCISTFNLIEYYFIKKLNLNKLVRS